VEIKMNEFLGILSTRYTDTHRSELLIKQWAYEALSIMSEGEGFQEIVWKWENDGTWTNSYVAVPNDVRKVKRVFLNGRICNKVTRNNKALLNTNEYYESGPYLHFFNVPNKVEAEVERIKTDADGDMVMEESDALAVIGYVLYQIASVAFHSNSDKQAHSMLREKMDYRQREWLTLRRQARGEFNSTNQTDQYMANIEWHNTFRSIRQTW